MNITSLTKIGFISSIGLILALSINTASAAKLYKWVDAQGRISYQDNPPPINSKILSEETLKDKKNVKQNSGSVVNTNPIDVYVTSSCPSCETTLALLVRWGVPHTEKSIEDNRDIQTRLLELTGGIVVPALFDGNQLIEDSSSIEDLRASLEKTGHLKANASAENEPVVPNKDK